jgi:hypothetical protein
VPGSRGALYLVFESSEKVRRFWIFPSNWRELDNDALWRFGELFSPAVSEDVMRAQTLQSVFIASLLAEQRASPLVARATEARRASQSLAQELQQRLEECRATRRAMRESVSAYARKAKDSGCSAAEIQSELADSIQRTAFVLQDSARTDRLARDVARWCAHAFKVA